MTGILERLYWEFERRVFGVNRGVVKYDDIVWFVRELQRNEFDAHIVIAGQNGVGKSMLMLTLAKLLNEKAVEDLEEHILYAFNSYYDLINTIKKMKNDVLCVDELTTFFNYKMSMTTEQNVLFNFIEVARANRIAFIGCCRDPRKINNNYRNGKVQMVIWLLDRYEAGEERSYGLVFLGTPVLEDEDRFGFFNFVGVKSFEDMRVRAEQLSTFYGYLFVDDVRKYISEDVLAKYNQLKQKGIEEVHLRGLKKLALKEKKTEEPTENKKVDKKVEIEDVIIRASDGTWRDERGNIIG